jgi:eukaryotic-like serine/threonine-protein kinase
MSEAMKSSGVTAEGTATKAETFGRYVLYAPIARGGMATVHIARLVGAEGFSRIVAAKRLHEQYTEDPDFVTMFLDEARISSKLHHPNVVSVLDVVLSGKDIVLVQEYVHGVPLDKLVKASQTRGEQIPVRVAVAIACGALLGLHSAHETKDELGEPLNIVHRDVSPQNLIVSADGIPRLLDFGIAKARSSAHVTQEGFFKGKITYIPPEQLRGEPPARTTDIYAAGVVLWELLVGRRMHAGRGESELFSAVLSGSLPSVEEAAAEQRGTMGEERWANLVKLSPVVSKALSKNPSDRFATAEEMADALRLAVPGSPANELSAWVKELGAEFLEARQRVISANEESWRSMRAIGAAPPSGPSVSSGMTSGVQPLSAHLMASTTPMPSPSPTLPDNAYRPQEASSMKRLLPILLILLLVGVGVVIFMMGRNSNGPVAGPPVADPSPTGLSAPPPTATTAAALATAAPTTSAAATAAPTADPSADKPQPVQVVVRPAPRPAPPPPRPAVHPTPPPPTPTPAPAASANCNPPYYFEGTRKVFKPGCI